VQWQPRHRCAHGKSLFLDPRISCHYNKPGTHRIRPTSSSYANARAIKRCAKAVARASQTLAAQASADGRYDADLIAAVSATGDGWRARSNGALRERLSTRHPGNR